MQTVTHADAVIAESLVKSFGRMRAVDSTSLRVPRGEVIGIVGSNGAGKSTLARIVAGFLRPESGTATICGLEASDYRRREGIGFLPEETARDWGNARVVDVITLCALKGTAVESDPLIGLLQLAPILHKRVSHVSKGQWRSALVAAALIRAPAFAVLDEPDAGLDPLALGRMSDAIRHTASNGSAILILSHHLDEMARVADRILIMRAGRIVDELRRGPGGFPSLIERYTSKMSEVV